jgi:hypothetical protein
LPHSLVVWQGKLLGFRFDEQSCESSVVSLDGGNRTTVVAEGIPGRVRTHTATVSGGLVFAVLSIATSNSTSVLRVDLAALLGSGALSSASSSGGRSTASFGKGSGNVSSGKAGGEALGAGVGGLGWVVSTFHVAGVSANAGFSEVKSFNKPQ